MSHGIITEKPAPLRDQYGRFAKHAFRHRDPRCIDDPCPAGIRWLCEEKPS